MSSESVSSSTNNFEEWDETAVSAWLVELGFPQYVSQIQQNNITGQVLCLLDHSGLVTLGVTSLGHRLAILKAIDRLKMKGRAAGLRPIADSDMAAPSRGTSFSTESLEDMILEQEQRMNHLEDQNRMLYASIQTLLVASLTHDGDSEDRREIMRWARSVQSHLPVSGLSAVEEDARTAHSETAAYSSTTEVVSRLSRVFPPSLDILSTSSSTADHNIENPLPTPQSLPPPTPTPPGLFPSVAPLKPRIGSSKSRPADIVMLPPPPKKRSKIDVEDPTSRVLPAAMLKHGLNAGDWKSHTLFLMLDGLDGARAEIEMQPEDKPLLTFNKARAHGRNPEFRIRRKCEALSSKSLSSRTRLTPQDTMALLNRLEGSPANLR
ncbi:hypothetical protein FISHEDRAFT_69592 [Fistulina hepatica ATCC 64428]|uniref:SAM domain-containing protein n=1 Tax=Fistulina hepatica ATCC 64428 TaxID=1128425 RepID=A0A0D7AN96_9AGAR|nr:hypothetical protein FISHEDRAFT_69592 [Fistulina hepatica ATCC 64428]